jgi:hypothetical protein
MAVHNTYTEEQVRQIKEEKLIQAEFLDRYGSTIAGWFAIAVLVAISFAQYGPELSLVLVLVGRA